MCDDEEWSVAARGRPSFRVEIARPEREVVVVIVSGDIDVESQEGLVRQASAQVHRCRHLVLDLSGVGFLAASGVSALMEIERRTRAADVELRIVGVTGRPIARPLEVLGLTDLLPIDGRAPDG